MLLQNEKLQSHQNQCCISTTRVWSAFNTHWIIHSKHLYMVHPSTKNILTVFWCACLGLNFFATPNYAYQKYNPNVHLRFKFNLSFSSSFRLRFFSSSSQYSDFCEDIKWRIVRKIPQRRLIFLFKSMAFSYWVDWI